MSPETQPNNEPAKSNVVDGVAGDSEQQVERLDAQVVAIRDDLDDLVGELDRRRHRVAKPLAIGAIVVAVGIAGVLVWRSVRSRAAVT